MIYDRFKYSEVEDYIDTTIDYLKYFLNKDVTVNMKYIINLKDIVDIVILIQS
jgi:hypothetical protein